VTEEIPESLAADQTPAPNPELPRILEALLLASEQPLSLDQLQRLLAAEQEIGRKELRAALELLADSLQGRAAELQEVASGFRIQVRREYAGWVARLWQEKPPRLSRALLETLAIICYQQPVTRGEVEDIRGVTLSPNIIRTLLERGWIREVGVKEVPGRPTLFGTTQQLLDDLNLRSLDDLPSLPEVKDPAQLEAALERLVQPAAAMEPPAGDAPPRPEATVH
jgi:segregation and condensation protein B